MKKLILCSGLIPALYFAQIPQGYYSGTENLAGYPLKSKLHEIISQNNISWHYGDLQDFYATTDLDKYYDHDASNTQYLLDIYSEKPAGADAYEYTKDNMIGSANAEGLGWNREHAMPQSTFNSNYPMYSDLFFVIPTDARINQLRSNYPYGVAGATNYYTFSNGSKINNSAVPNSTYTGRVYEPIDEFKGDVARMLLYFAIRYEGKLNTFKYMAGTTAANDTNPLDGTEERAFESWYINLLLKWNAQDPVSQRETDRNNAVYAIQKNRNPLIDHPEWVNLIWSQSNDNLTPAAVNISVGNVSSYFATVSWSPSTEADVLGYRVYINGAYSFSVKSPSAVIDHLAPNTSYTVSVKPYDAGYLEAPESNTVQFTTVAESPYAKDIIITKYLEGTGNNRAIEIKNSTGHDVDLSNYRLGIQFKSDTNYYFPAPLELEGTVKSGETFVVINPKADFSCYPTASAKIITAAPQLTFSGSQYVELSYKSSTVDAVGVRGSDNSGNLANVSLYRQTSITQPTTSFNIAEWQRNPSDFCENLGSLASAEVVLKDEFSVFPNPATDRLYLNGLKENTDNVKIFDVSGKLLYNENAPLKQKKYIDVSALKPGVYILSAGGKSVKFIKK